MYAASFLPLTSLSSCLCYREWSRPQNDGPALRAITLMHIANLLQAEQTDTGLLAKLHQLISTDLTYVQQHWQERCYNLWEESLDYSFFTSMVQRRALWEGAQYEQQWGDAKKAATYQAAVLGIEKMLNRHWQVGLGYFREGLQQTVYKGGDMNISILLGALLGNTDELDDSFAPDSDRMLSTAFFIRTAFESLYLINLKHTDKAPLIGRYPNDTYDGKYFVYGNPWFMATSTLAQFYYTVAKRLQAKGEIKLNATNYYFYQQLNPKLKLSSSQTISKNREPELFNIIIRRLVKAGDEVLTTIKSYAQCYKPNDCLHLSEQIDRANGEQVSAKDLTWSYASLLTAIQSRQAIT